MRRGVLKYKKSKKGTRIMEIEARTRLDLRTLQAINALALFGKHDPRRRMRFTFTVVGVCTGIVLLCELLLLALGDSLPPWIFIALGVILACSAVLPLLYRTLPKKQYKKLGIRRDTEMRYLFGEGSIRVMTETENGEFQADETIPFSLLRTVKETTAFFFIYINKAQLFPVDKQTLSAAEVEAVRERLRAALPYTLCQY